MTQRRERAYPIPRTHCEKAKECDERAVQLEAREAVTADGAFDVALGQLALSFLGIGGVGFTLYYAHRAFVETQSSAAAALEANRISRAALVADHRPWVAILGVNLANAITFHPQNGWFIGLTFVLKNTGATPAISVFPNYAPLVPIAQRDLGEVQRQRCDRWRQPNPFGSTLFPDQTMTQTVSTNITLADLADAIDLDGGQIILSPTIIGAISYQSTVDDLVHQTRFVLDILWSDNRAIFAPKQPGEGFEFPVADLTLRSSPMFWTAD